MQAAEQLDIALDGDSNEKANDHAFVPYPARIAIYDDLLSSPKILDIDPAPTRDFLGKLASTIHEEAKAAGGSIPYSVISQVSENFIHANFAEMVVSILDNGNTIRFSDQGPGISDKEMAQQPGYSTATLEMKRYINGVGSGLPIVKEYLETKQGQISISDNLGTGAVVTLTLDKVNRYGKHADFEFSSSHGRASHPSNDSTQMPFKEEMTSSFVEKYLSPRSKAILGLFKVSEIWGVSQISTELNMALSTTHSELKKLEEAGIIEKLARKRILTELGREVTSTLD